MAGLALGTGVVGAALVGATPALADGSSASNATAATSAPSAALGGFQVTASGAGIRTTYEQPNFPVPATPTLEGNIGFATTSYDYGPTGSSTASTLWPGQVAAGFGSQLPLLLEPYLGSATPTNLNVGPWPVQATSSYPAAAGAQSSASQDANGVTMESTSDQDEGTATASFGTGTGTNAPAALPSGVVQVQSIASSVLGTVQGTTAGAQAVAQATSALHGVTVAGLITIGAVTTTATSTSDGTTPDVTGSSTVSQLAIAGQSATVDQSGLHVAGQSQNLLGGLLPSADKILQTAGISLALAQPTDTVSGAGGERILPGLEITIDLTQYDRQFNSLLAMLPAQLRGDINMLPIPFPAEQIMTIDLGWVAVKSTAAPSFDAGGSSPSQSGDAGAGTGDLGPGGDLGSSGTPGSLGTLDTAGTAAFSPTGGSSAGTPGTPPTTALQAAASTPVALFRGLGAGLIVLGLLLAGALAFLLLRADAAVGALSAAPACEGEERPDL